MRRLRAGLARLTGMFTAIAPRTRTGRRARSASALHIDDNLRAGMSAAEARRQALLKFGPVESMKERYRDRGGIPIVSHVARDVRFALRLLRKSPGFSATVIVTIGACGRRERGHLYAAECCRAAARCRCLRVTG